jgi:PAS domain S-box-containing protein
VSDIPAASAEVLAERAAQRDLFMQAPVAIAILEGPEHTFTFANPAYRALVNGRDVVGKPLLVALPDLRGQGFDALIDRVMVTGEPFVGEEVPIKLEHHVKDELLFLNFSYTPKRNTQGTIDGVMVSGFDVTEQVRARRRVEALAMELRGSEAELRLVTDALPVLVSFVGADERYRFLNRAYEEWFGVSRESLVGKTLREVIGELAYERLRPFVLRGLAGERCSFEQYGVPYRLGGTRDIKVSFVPLLDPDGSTDGYVALLEDITERRRAEEELLRQSRKIIEAEDVLRELVDNLPELAWSAQADGSIDFYNRRWFEYTGTTLEEMQGWGWEKVHDSAMLPDVVARWRRSLDAGTPFEMEFPLRRADGEFRWFMTRVQPLRDGAGKVIRWFGVNSDIHEQRELGRRAEEASRAKDEFLATASHELRTPLTAILGWARMLRSGQVDPSAYARGLETIERNAMAQVQLIEDILDGSRIITGKLHLEIRPLDLTALVRAALDAVRPAADAKSIRLTMSLSPDAARVMGDPERLQQVVWNLANNAVKFTPRAGAVDIALTRSGTHIELAVTDTGQGIGRDFLPHVFERFRQAEGTSSRRHGGLGLGLALVRHLVEAHGGRVHAESEGEGRGSRFVVLLPVQAVYQVPEDVDRPRPTPVEAVTGVAPSASLAGVSVLVVDNEQDARELIAVVLRAAGATVTTAGDAIEALDVLAATTQRVLISDIGMPEIDGYELIRRVRNLAGARGATIPAVALTAYSREQDRRLALEAGFQTHVSKPVEPAELVRVVLGLASIALGRAPAKEPVAPLEKADTFLKLEKILGSRGVHEALRFLNSRTPHRFTALYRFDPPMLRNIAMFDTYAPEVKTGDDSPLAETYCSIVGQFGTSFTTDDARQDDRLRAHPARDTVVSYCGVLLRDGEGRPFGTLCHFDLVPCEVPMREMPLMEAAAALFTIPRLATLVDGTDTCTTPSSVTTAKPR